MDEPLLLFLFLIAFILIAGFPIGMSGLIYYCIRKYGVDKKWSAIAVLPVLVYGYCLYDTLYPREEFYRNEFAEGTGFKLPEKAIIQYKTVSFPDHFGDYTSIALIKVDSTYCSTLLNQLPSQGFVEQRGRKSSIEFHEVLQHMGAQNVERLLIAEHSGMYCSLGLLSDKESLLVKKVRW